MHRHLLVTGSHRSGSTHVGKVIARSPRYSYIDEPFNHLWGIEGVDRLYPTPSEKYRAVMDGLIDLKFKFKVGPRHNPLRYVAKRIVGNRIKLRGEAYKRIGRHYSSMLLKDPMAAYLSDYAHDEHGIHVLVLVRHPVAFARSLDRMGWRASFDHLKHSPEFVDRHLSAERALMDDDLSDWERSALYWRCIYKVLQDYSTKNEASDRWLVLRHEDICIEPDPHFARICGFVGIDYHPRMQAYVQRTMNASLVQPDDDKYLHLERDSKALAYDWMGKVTRSQAESARKITEPVAGAWYGDDEWCVRSGDAQGP